MPGSRSGWESAGSLVQLFCCGVPSPHRHWPTRAAVGVHVRESQPVRKHQRNETEHASGSPAAEDLPPRVNWRSSGIDPQRRLLSASTRRTSPKEKISLSASQPMSPSLENCWAKISSSSLPWAIWGAVVSIFSPDPPGNVSSIVCLDESEVVEQTHHPAPNAARAIVMYRTEDFFRFSTIKLLLLKRVGRAVASQRVPGHDPAPGSHRVPS